MLVEVSKRTISVASCDNALIFAVKCGRSLAYAIIRGTTTLGDGYSSYHSSNDTTA